MNIYSFSDQKLYNLCREYGALALKARNKFIGLLPEVNARKLYAKKFTSINHFAAVLAGVSVEQVSRVLSLNQKFENLALLKQLLVSGTVSINKLARIASIANSENEEDLANKVLVLSKSALETYVRDLKIEIPQEPKGLFETKTDDDFVPGHKPYLKQRAINDSMESRTKFIKIPQLSDEVKEKLNALQEKDIDINAIILEALNKREEDITAQKVQIAEEVISAEKPATRYVKVKIQKVISAEFGTKCAIDGCKKVSQQLHHTARFSVSRSHNPHFLAPLCKDHHQIAHATDILANEYRKRAAS